MISIIAALDKNKLIGKDGALPWHIKEDLQNFKKITMNKPMVMGRKTFESFRKPLPGRPHIILSTKKIELPENCFLASNIEEAIEQAKKFQQEIMIIGGANVYQQFLPLADKMYLSFVEGEYSGDTYFPEYDEKKWQCAEVERFSEFEVKVFQKV